MMHSSTEAILKHFEYSHLPPFLQEVSKPFNILAYSMAGALVGPEVIAGLRKLLEAKDCMVRAALDTQREKEAVKPFKEYGKKGLE